MKNEWIYIGCQPASQACECGAVPAVIHTVEQGALIGGMLAIEGTHAQKHVCLVCAENLVRPVDRGLPTWAEERTLAGGLGIAGWTSRWHWEDTKGPWVAR